MYISLTGRFLQLLIRHYTVRIGYQREHKYVEIVLKHVFLNNTFTFSTIGLLDTSCSKIPATNLKHRTT